MKEPEKANDKFREFVQQGLEVAEKTRLWVPTAQPPASSETPLRV